MKSTHDPVLVKRAKISRLTSLSMRAGLGLYALASVFFAIALVSGFTTFLTSSMTVFLILGSLILAPAMVFHYAVKAADRADRENSW